MRSDVRGAYRDARMTPPATGCAPARVGLAGKDAAERMLRRKGCRSGQAARPERLLRTTGWRQQVHPR